MFSELILQGEKITAIYSRAFQILSELVKLTNSSKVQKREVITARIFEPKKKIDFTIQTGDFYSHRPNWLREPKLLIPIDYTKIIQAFQDLRYIGELRQRWQEIKKLSSVPQFA